MKCYNKNYRGDTIIEIMFATAIASLVIVLALAVMNRSFAQVQMSVETTFVRQSIDSQAEVIRYARDAYLLDQTVNSGGPKVWRDIITTKATTIDPSSFGTCTPPGSAFFINRKPASDDPSDDAVNIDNLSVSSSYTAAETFARIGQGIWVEAVKGGVVGGPQFIDFHIRACWEPPFAGSQNATLGTIVRLYTETPSSVPSPPPPPLPPPPPPPPIFPMTWATDGASFSGCSPSPHPISCLVRGTSVASYLGGQYSYPAFQVSYNAGSLQTGNYRLVITYSNLNNEFEPGPPPPPPPPGYSYRVNIYVNGVLRVANYDLPADPIGNQLTSPNILVGGIASPPNATIMVEWINDQYLQVGGVIQNDANLKIDSLSLDKL